MVLWREIATPCQGFRAGAREGKESKGLVAFAGLHPGRGSPPPPSAPGAQSTLPGACKLGPRTGPQRNQMRFPPSPMLWLNRTARCQASIMGVIYVQLQGLQECSPLSTVCVRCSGLHNILDLSREQHPEDPIQGKAGATAALRGSSPLSSRCSRMCPGHHGKCQPQQDGAVQALSPDALT